MGATLQPESNVSGHTTAENALLPNPEVQAPRGHSAVPASWIHFDSRASSTIAWPLILGGGLIAGTVWGINARLWMRYISTDPDFTWGGTLFIVLGFAIVGSSQSIAYVARTRVSTRWKLTLVRMATFAGVVPIFGGAGGLMAPTVLLGALSASHGNWPRWFRVLLGIGAALPVIAVSTSVSADFPVLHTLLATIWLFGIYAVVVWAAQFSLAQQQDGWRPPTTLRLVGFAGVLPLVLGAAFTLFVGL